MIFGFSASARAIAILWRWPPENSWGYFWAKRGARPTTRMSSSTWLLDLGGADPVDEERLGGSRGPSSAGSARRTGPGRSSAGRAGRPASRPARPRRGCGRSGSRRPRSSGRAGGSCAPGSTCRSRTRRRGPAPRPWRTESVTPSTALTAPVCFLTRKPVWIGKWVFTSRSSRMFSVIGVGEAHATLDLAARARTQAWRGREPPRAARALGGALVGGGEARSGGRRRSRGSAWTRRAAAPGS
jgi:hypothetical protein